MKAFRRYLDKIKPNFEKGKKYGKLKSTFEAFETFIYVPDKVTTKGSHIRDVIDMKRTMIIVVLALIPTILFGMWNTGHLYNIATGTESTIIQAFRFGFLKIFPIIVVSYITGLGIEFIFAQVRGHEVNEGYLVTGMLIPLVLPVGIPLWMVALASAFAVIIGKEVFGGTGMNILNPALTARAFLFFAYPAEMSGSRVWVALKNAKDTVIDGFSGETILSQAAGQKDVFANGINEYSAWDMFFGTIPGSIGETSTLAILIGAFILIFTGIGSLKIIFSVFAGGLGMGLILNLFAVNAFMEIPAWQHLLLGGFAFGAVFMATDPVTATQTEKGKYIYGLLIGILAILIRVLNPGYPEGMMLAILFMNVFSPLIDHYIIEANIKKRLKRINTIKSK